MGCFRGVFLGPSVSTTSHRRVALGSQRPHSQIAVTSPTWQGPRGLKWGNQECLQDAGHVLLLLSLFLQFFSNWISKCFCSMDSIVLNAYSIFTTYILGKYFLHFVFCLLTCIRVCCFGSLGRCFSLYVNPCFLLIHMKILHSLQTPSIPFPLGSLSLCWGSAPFLLVSRPDGMFQALPVCFVMKIHVPPQIWNFLLMNFYQRFLSFCHPCIILDVFNNYLARF